MPKLVLTQCQTYNGLQPLQLDLTRLIINKELINVAEADLSINLDTKMIDWCEETLIDDCVCGIRLDDVEMFSWGYNYGILRKFVGDIDNHFYYAQTLYLIITFTNSADLVAFKLRWL